MSREKKSQNNSELVEREENVAGSEHENGRISFSEKEIETLKNTVAKDADEHEFKMFLSLARRYGLDPFNKEIFFFKVNGQPQITTSRDGYLKIADRHPEYDGLVSDVVKENDKFRRRIDGIEHEYGTKRGDIIGAYALVYRKDRKYPIYVFAPMNEYDANTRVWRQYPSAMILKCAESMALKRAFTVSGLVSREEMKIVHLREDEKMSSRDEVASSPGTEAIENASDTDSAAEDKQNNPESFRGSNISSDPSNSSASNNSNNPASRENNHDRQVNDKKDNNSNSLTSREQEIKNIVGDSKELKEELINYLGYVKEKSDLDKISLKDLNKEQFQELKQILEDIKGMIDKSA